jgi:heme oxygenase
MNIKSFRNKVYALADKMGYYNDFLIEVVNIRRFQKITGMIGMFAAAWEAETAEIAEGIIFNSNEISNKSWKTLKPYIKHEIAHLITGYGDEDARFMEYCEINEIPYYVGTVDGNWKLFN